MVLDVDGEELVDAPEIAGRLGLKTARQVLDLRVHRLGFPEPVGRRGRKLMWSWPQVVSWSDLSLSALPTSAFSAGQVGQELPV
jgi:hypothetical protein